MKNTCICFIITMLSSFAGFSFAGEAPRDPFVSLGDKMELTQKPEESIHLPYPLVLKGTLCSKDSPAAIINGEILKEGQNWRDFSIVKIEKSKVSLEWQGKRFEIFLDSDKKEDRNK